MLNTIFTGVFDTTTTNAVQLGDFLLCVAVSLVIGVYLAAVYTYKSRCTQSFVMTLALLPAVVCVVIMMVNGNVGAGVAVAGAFSLVRFRSVPGSAKEICAIFLAMGAGLVTGMGYLGYAAVFAFILGSMMFLYTHFQFGKRRKKESYKTLHITIPEDLDYTGVFDEILEKYTREYQLVNVKTTNMGSLFKLTYNVVIKDAAEEKNFIDKLRCRNGNLEISMSMQDNTVMEL